jgi:hypothetical protein
MNTMSLRSAGGRRSAARAIATFSCALALLWIGAAGARAQTPPQDATGVTATLEQCVATGAQAERSATFAGEMTSIPGAAKMSMRIDVEERTPGEVEYHPLSAPGLGVWRAADPKVKVYKYLRQATNLSSPASYRGLVRFRWLNSKGHVIKHAERLTTRCVQPAPAIEPTTPASSASRTTHSTLAGTAPST